MRPSSTDHGEGRVYRAREFADLAGVTIRALHHYDRLGLLTPRRTAAGHRVYASPDLASLEQIVALKAIGVPLKDIAVLRDASGAALASALRSQRALLEQQRRLLARLVAAIHDVEDALGSGRDAGLALLRRIVEVIDVQKDDCGDQADAGDRGDLNHEEWRMVVRETSAHRRSLPPQVLADLGKEWEVLLGDIQSVVDQDPFASAVQQLARRWVGLLKAMNGPAVPLPLLLRCGQGTLRELEKRRPGIRSTPWGRSVNLMVRAVASQGLQVEGRGSSD